MVRLSSSNILNDSRVLREASALSQTMDVTLLEIKNGRPKEIIYIDTVQIILIPIITKGLPKYSVFKAVKYCEYLFKILFKLLVTRADVIHCHDLDPLPVAWLASRLKGAKIIYDSHELATEQDSTETIQKKVWRKIERSLLNRVNGVIAANESRAFVMHTEYGAHQMPTVIMNIAEKVARVQSDLLRRYAHENGAPLGLESKLVLYQGGFSEDRGLKELVLSFNQLSEEYVLILMGYGEFKEVLQGIIESHKLSNRVFIHDAVPTRELHRYSCSADLGIITYKNTCRNNYYCAPNKMFEYAMSGLPVVGADLPEIRKIVKKYDIGELFNPEDPGSIAEAILSTIEDSTRYERLRLNLNAVVRDFTWENEKAKLLRLYVTIFQQS